MNRKDKPTLKKYWEANTSTERVEIVEDAFELIEKLENKLESLSTKEAEGEEEKKHGMDKISIYRFQLDTIQNTMRLLGNTFKMRTKETCLSRDFIQSEKYIENALNGNIEEVVNRF